MWNHQQHTFEGGCFFSLSLAISEGKYIYKEDYILYTLEWNEKKSMIVYRYVVYC
jgi:hypothetical protein